MPLNPPVKPFIATVRKAYDPELPREEIATRAAAIVGQPLLEQARRCSPALMGFLIDVGYALAELQREDAYRRAVIDAHLRRQHPLDCVEGMTRPGRCLWCDGPVERSNPNRGICSMHPRLQVPE